MRNKYYFVQIYDTGIRFLVLKNSGTFHIIHYEVFLYGLKNIKFLTEETGSYSFPVYIIEKNRIENFEEISLEEYLKILNGILNLEYFK